MAPALPLTQLPHYDAVDETERISHRRRALASVNITPMDDDMGLQNQPSLAKDSQEMEQILVELGNTDLAQGGFLQVIKTLDTGDTLSTGDTDAIFSLSGFELTDTVESEADTDDKLRQLCPRFSRLERRYFYLMRRIRILNARMLSKRISDEVAQTFDKSTRGACKDGGGRPMAINTLLKRVDTTAALQASASSRSVVGPKYYQAGTSKGDASRSSIGIASGTLTGLEDTSGALRSHLSVVKKQLDSDATASSSGAESNDEAVPYNNPHQQHMPIEKRALWSWQKNRASMASRWCWLLVQIQELDYKLRQHKELHAQVREAKGPVEFEGEPVAYEGSLPGDEEHTSTCARVRPLRRDTFKKRKLLQMHNLHIATNKASKPSDVRCSCMCRVESCSVCTGRAEPTQPTPPFSTLAPRQRLALVDPCFHPVLSDIKDIPPSIHMSALSSRSWFRSRFNKTWRGGAHHSSQSHPQPQQSTPRPVKRHSTRLKRGRPPLSRKIKERDRDDDTSISGQERRSRSSTDWRLWRRQSYDIDNIVIPQSVAANTRPEILTYKEIITPKWRVMELPETPLNNGVTKYYHRLSIDSEEEDISEAAVQARHTRAETRERSKFMRKRRSRRNNTDENNSHPQAEPPQEEPALVPEPLPLPAQPEPQPPPQPQPQTQPQPQSQPQPQPQPQPMRQPSPTTETVRPYSPRLFPLPENQYIEMLSGMPEGYRPLTPEAARVDEFESSSLSPMSPLAYDADDDPDDAEWEPNVEKSERRKSTFR